MKLLTIDKEPNEAVRDLLGSLLSEGKAAGVLCLTREGDSGAVRYGLITDPERLGEAVPFYPAMPNNAGKLLSAMTLRGAAGDPIAAVVRPCELRAFIEVLKRQQGDGANIITVSSTCPGVLPLKRLVRGGEADLVENYWSAAAQVEPSPDIRQACRACRHFVPGSADFVVDLAGRADLKERTRVFAASEKALSLCEGVEAESGEAELESAEIGKIREARSRVAEESDAETGSKASGLSGIVDFFASCVACRACRTVCPICYCRRCDFEAPYWEYGPRDVETNLRKRGAVRVPPGTVNFHVGRLLHMGLSCVGCGMCTDVCPVDIPVSDLFSNTGASVQELFGYEPGRDAEEKIPITTFEENELSEVER